MQARHMTDPFTGADFSAMQMKDQLVIPNAISGAPMIFEIEDNAITIPLSYFDYISLMDARETAMELHISRQRLCQLVNSDTLKPVYIGNSQYFCTDAVLEYKKTRKPGRPRKE